jgi:hypothetical protein
MNNIEERLAAYAHNAWAGWMQYLYENSIQIDGVVVIPRGLALRWKRQMETDYFDLPETEKDSDRKEAKMILEIIHDWQSGQGKGT